MTVTTPRNTLRVGSGPFVRSGILFGLLLPVFTIHSALAQQAKPAAPEARPIARRVESPLKFTGILFKYNNRRDPFLNPLLTKRPKEEVDEELSRGVPPPGIAGTYIAQAVLQGTSIREDGRRAIVRGADTRSYFLKEGDKLFDGYLKTIEHDSITLVRETKLRSGKILTQDVIKRLRTP